MDHMPEHATPTPTIDGPKLAAIAAFGARFEAFAGFTDPLQAITEAAHLKGRIDVLLQIQVFDLTDAMEARNLVDITLAALHDQHLDWKVLDAPVSGLMADLRNHVLVL